MNKLQYVSATTCRIGTGRIMLALYGPRGGTAFTGELTLDDAKALCAELQFAIMQCGGKPGTAVVEEIIDHDNEGDAEDMKPGRINYGAGQV